MINSVNAEHLDFLEESESSLFFFLQLIHLVSLNAGLMQVQWLQFRVE